MVPGAPNVPEDEPRTSSLTRGYSAVGGPSGGRKAIAEDFMKDVEDEEEERF